MYLYIKFKVFSIIGLFRLSMPIFNMEIHLANCKWDTVYKYIMSTCTESNLLNYYLKWMRYSFIKATNSRPATQMTLFVIFTQTMRSTIFNPYFHRMLWLGCYHSDGETNTILLRAFRSASSISSQFRHDCGFKIIFSKQTKPSLPVTG